MADCRYCLLHLPCLLLLLLLLLLVVLPCSRYVLC
jgi:hypothetical protein